MLQTVCGSSVDATVLNTYFETLVNLLFKILPMREGEEKTLDVYMKSLRCELLGCYSLCPEVGEDSSLMSIISILQYLIDHPECQVSDVRREVFHAISICNRMKKNLTEVRDGDMG